MTSRTTISQLAAGHRHKRTFRSLNDLEIADHEAGIERDRAEGLQPLVRIVHQLDAYLRDFHGRPPCRGLFSSAGKALFCRDELAIFTNSAAAQRSGCQIVL